jgi:hypothetical protein
MSRKTRGLKTVNNSERVRYIYGNPAMGGQGEHADLHPPMWSGDT